MLNAHINWTKLPENRASINILNDFESYSICIKVLQDFSDYVLRYRAAWDKIMGLLILLYTPNNYETYYAGKSRKKMFSKYMPEFISDRLTTKYLSDLVQSFDDDFRTPEAHGTGVLRKWVLEPAIFTKITIDDPNNRLVVTYWNNLILVLSEIEKHFISDINNK